jgi:hypothetical protein
MEEAIESSRVVAQESIFLGIGKLTDFVIRPSKID